jgi:integrase
MSDAVRKGTLVRNVAIMADPPRAKDTKPAEMAWWTPEQLRTFLDLIAGESLGPLLRAAATTGIRRGEVCVLRWSA